MWRDLVTATSEPLLDEAALCVASTLSAPPMWVLSPPPSRADVPTSDSVTDQPPPAADEACDLVASVVPDERETLFARVTSAPSATAAPVVEASLAKATAAPVGAVEAAVVDDCDEEVTVKSPPAKSMSAAGSTPPVVVDCDAATATAPVPPSDDPPPVAVALKSAAVVVAATSAPAPSRSSRPAR